MPFSNRSAKSRAVVVAVTLFLAFDFAALALNIWLSTRIEAAAVAINLAGRQRMLSQRMVKVLLQMADDQRDGVAAGPRLPELRLTFNLFDSTLQGFSSGGETRGGDDKPIHLPPVEGRVPRAIIGEANFIWVPYRTLVAALIGNGLEPDPDRLAPAVAYAEANEQALLVLMNRLTTEIERGTQREAMQIRLAQGIAFGLALLNFAVAMGYYNRRIREHSRQQDIFSEIINRVSAAVFVLDGNESTVLMANNTAAQLFGYRREDFTGMPFEKLVTGKEGNWLARRHDGSSFMATTEREKVFMDGRVLFIETVADITQQRMTEERLTSLAYHDALTGLPNRLLFDDLLRLEMAHARRRRTMLAVFFIDLDKFKPVNDRYGHEVGDLLLKEVASRLRGSFRESDIVARRGGDEFTVILSDINTHRAIEVVAEKALAALQAPVLLATPEGDRSIEVGGSIGISLYPEDGTTAEELVTHADEAMYEAKRRSRGSYAFFSNPTDWAAGM